jgi:hypothetical protein
MKILAPLAFLLLVGCASQQHPVENTAPVSLGSWCEEVISSLCHATAQRCFPGKPAFEASCQESSRSSCVGGRDRALSSGRNSGELRQCVKAIDKMDCPALQASSGKLQESCAAHVEAVGTPGAQSP